MPRKKLSEEERKEQKRIAERVRMTKIKNDPELYTLWKERQKESYLKKKRLGKIIPIREMTPKKQKLARIKTRENSRRCYYKKKTALSQSGSRTLNSEQSDNLHLAASSLVGTNQNPTCMLQKHQTQTEKSSTKLPQSPVSISSNSTARITRSTTKQQETHRQTGIDSTEHVTEISPVNDVHISGPRSPSSIASTIDSPGPFNLRRNILDSPLMMSSAESHRSSPAESVLNCHFDLYTTESPSPLSPQSSASLNSSPKSAKKLGKVNKTDTSVKKKSPWKHLLRRFKYRSNKELQLKEKKIRELKLVNERYRKQIKRLQKDKVIKNSLKHIVTISRQETIQTETETMHNVIENTTQNLRQDVERFLEDDDNSRICPGKKEYITLKKVKKQKRYLTDSLQNLHNKFVRSHAPQTQISYSCFCKLRPFWIVTPNVQIRDTCLCKDHENMDLAVTALRKNNLIAEKNTRQVLQSLCCDPVNVSCLSRNCNLCKNRDLHFKEFDNSIETHYWIWSKVKKTYLKDGIEKNTIQTVKKKVTAFPKEIIEHFQKLLTPFMKHCGNITNQYNYITKLKDSLKSEECIIHCDFSENYNTKYASEIQSFHFGSSRQQITLHTSVIYYLKNEELIKQSFATLSDCLRHDAVAVWEHLLPLLKFLENEVPDITTIHFVSDSPSAQYRNRKMFYIMAKLHWYFPSLRLVIWNYTEKGHGKGAPDGVGGTLKRTADQIVARGKDIANINDLLKHLRAHISGVKLELVEESGILEKEMLVPANLKEFRGTMNIHQAVWSANKSDTLAMRQLSCGLDNCSQEAIECLHGQHIGFYCFENIASRDNSKVSKKPSTAKRTTAMKAPASRSLIKGGKTKKSFEAKKIYSGNDSDRTLENLDIPINDSFWAEVSSVDENVTHKLTKSVFSTLQQKDIEEMSDSDDDNIFKLISYKQPSTHRLTKQLDTDQEDIFDTTQNEPPLERKKVVESNDGTELLGNSSKNTHKWINPFDSDDENMI